MTTVDEGQLGGYEVRLAVRRDNLYKTSIDWSVLSLAPLVELSTTQETNTWTYTNKSITLWLPFRPKNILANLAKVDKFLF